MKQGSWWVTSKSDPRWKADGRGDVGMFAKPDGVDGAIALLKEEIGEEPPTDLEWGYMKD